MLTSRQNPRFQEVIKLKIRKHRLGHRRLLAEGPKLVEEGLAAGWKLCQLVVCREMLTAHASRLLDAGLPLMEVSPQLMNSVAETDSPQGILGVFVFPSLELEHVTGDLVLVVDGLQDPGNMGSLLRTAAAVNTAAVIALRGSVDITSPKVVRASMGGVFRVPWVQGLEPTAVVEWAKSANTRLVQLVPTGGTAFHQFDYNCRLGVVVGNEGSGVSRPLAMACSGDISIPMPGDTESLNAGVAAALVLYQTAIRRGVI